MMYRYGLFNFLLDVTLICLTGGFWIFVRETHRG